MQLRYRRSRICAYPQLDAWQEIPMAIAIAAPTLSDHHDAGLSDDDARAIFRAMLVARAMDERLWRLNRQGKIPLAMPARGQEGAQVGTAWALEPARDWLFP